MSQMFQYEVWPPYAVHCTVIMLGHASRRLGYYTAHGMQDLRMTLPAFLAQGDIGVQYVCRRMAEFHNQTFTTFDFDPPLFQE